jgi:hypothetical protein
MTDFETWETWRQLLERRDGLAHLRSGIDAISNLPPDTPSRELRRRAEAEWWATILETIGAAQ